MNDYLELLSGFLINNFHVNDVYDDGVNEACAYFKNFPEYKEEMKNVLEHILDNDFQENTLRDIVRKDANIFCSKDSIARSWLQDIYDDTILQKDRYQEEKELEKLLADAEADEELEDELQ